METVPSHLSEASEGGKISEESGRKMRNKRDGEDAEERKMRSFWKRNRGMEGEGVRIE